MARRSALRWGSAAAAGMFCGAALASQYADLGLHQHAGYAAAALAVWGGLSVARRRRCEPASGAGLMTGKRFLSCLKGAIERTSSGQECGLIVFDIDVQALGGLEQAAGYARTAGATREVAMRLERALGEGAFATVRGDSAIVVACVLEGVADFQLEQMARAKGLGLLRAIDAPVSLGEAGQGAVPVVVRAGVDLLAAGGLAQSPEAMIWRAGLAWGRGSSTPRKQMTTTVFRHEIAEQRERVFAIECSILDVIRSRRLAVFYQPIVDTLTMQIAKVEALARWPDRSFSPAEFIPVAERNGQISELTAYVLRTALEQKVAWQRQFAGAAGVDARALVVCVNVSMAALEDGGFFDLVMMSLATSGVSPRYLELEITETGDLATDEAALDVLQKLRRAGVLIAVDDFGTGFSSLSYLNKLEPHTVKIDRSFVCSVETQSKDRVLLEAMCRLCRGVGVEIVAEGVESVDQMRLLESFGVHLMQGFVFGRPRPAHEALELETGTWVSRI